MIIKSRTFLYPQMLNTVKQKRQQVLNFISVQEHIECVTVRILLCKSLEFPNILRKNVGGSLSAVETSFQSAFFTLLIYIKMRFFSRINCTCHGLQNRNIKTSKPSFVSVLWNVTLLYLVSRCLFL